MNLVELLIYGAAADLLMNAPRRVRIAVVAAALAVIENEGRWVSSAHPLLTRIGRC